MVLFYIERITQFCLNEQENSDMRSFRPHGAHCLAKDQAHGTQTGQSQGFLLLAILVLCCEERGGGCSLTHTRDTGCTRNCTVRCTPSQPCVHLYRPASRPGSCVWVVKVSSSQRPSDLYPDSRHPGLPRISAGHFSPEPDINIASRVLSLALTSDNVMFVSLSSL